LEILRHHHNSEFDVCIEGKTPWLGKERDLGRISHINDKDCCPQAVLHIEKNSDQTYLKVVFGPIDFNAGKSHEQKIIGIRTDFRRAGERQAKLCIKTLCSA
jgi:hypothetical protein